VPPILVAAKGERMLRLTARWADAWNTAWFGRVDDALRQRTSDLDAACAAVGRDRAAIRRTVGLRVHEPGQGADDAKGTDAGAAGLADLFDELEALGYGDALIWSLAKSSAALERIAEARRTHLARRAV
jgi:alkanesulfonate monooxygenase SsuD/methylene tetrahydromethanopterin reductase-like flavin-dependent oxidoreductase (luciferase family)